MGQKKISIVIPVYKVPEKLLNKCIDSVIVQSLKDIEIILVDDGSPDKCGDICDKYSQIDSRILVIHKENGGLSSARNAGCRSAQGEWIMFVDGDDWIEPQMCEELYSTTLKYNVDVVMCGMIKDYRRLAINYHYELKPFYIYKDEECAFLQEQILNYNSNIATTVTKLYRRNLLIEKDIFHNESLRQGAEGIEFNLRFFGNVSSAIYIDKWLYHYFYNEQSISSLHNEKNHEYVLKCFEQIKNEIKKYKNEEELNRWLNNRLIYVMITTAISGYFSPNNKETFWVKREKYKKYLKSEILQEALKSNEFKNLSKDRKIIFCMIKGNLYFGVALAAILRNWQKRYR